MTGIGHNGPPSDPKFTPRTKLVRIVEILDRPDLSATEKCVGIALVATSDPTGSCTLGRLELARMASAKDKTTIFAATEKLDNDIVKKVKTPGKPNTYQIISQRVVDEIVEAYADLKASRTESTQSSDDVPASSNPPGGLKLDRLDQPSGSELGGLNPTSGIEPTQLQPIATIAYIESPSEIVIRKKEEVRKGGVGENLPLLPDEPKRAKPRPKPTAEQFDRFWAEYPLRKAKEAAKQRFMALTPDQAEQAIAGARAFAAECVANSTLPKYIKYAQGWLSERRFTDVVEVEPTAVVGPNGKRWGWWRSCEARLKGLPLDHWRRGIAEAKPNGTWPWWILTAPPGHEECLVPMELQAPLIEIYKGKIEHD